MAETETYRKGAQMRRQLLGDAYADRTNQTTYADPRMKKFIDVATETVFGALWTRPGLDLKTRTLICVVSDAATGAHARAGHPPAHGAAPGMDGGRADRRCCCTFGLRRRAADPRGDAHGQGSLRRGEEGLRSLSVAQQHPRARLRSQRDVGRRRDALAGQPGVSRKRCAMVASSRTASIVAKLLPMQLPRSAAERKVGEPRQPPGEVASPSVRAGTPRAPRTSGGRGAPPTWAR